MRSPEIEPLGEMCRLFGGKPRHSRRIPPLGLAAWKSGWGKHGDLFMKPMITSLIAGVVGALTLGVTAASADHRPDYCDKDHDHRVHASNYYNYYPSDKYYRSSGLTISVSLGNDRYDRDRYDRDGYDRDRYDRGRYDHRDARRGQRGHHGRGRVVEREVYDTRYRARILLTEEIVRTRRGPQLVCTVKAVGPQARYVSKRRMYRIAHRECSRRAQVRVYT